MRWMAMKMVSSVKDEIPVELELVFSIAFP